MGDFVYTLAPLPLGGVFTGRMEFEGGAAALLENTGTDAGIALALALDGLSPDSVTVEYLAGGVPVAAPLTYLGGARLAARGSGPLDSGTPSESYSGGTSNSEPTSYHYRVVDGEIIIIEDYDSTSPGPTVDGGAGRSAQSGSAFTTARGEQVVVTHVAFTLHGVAPGVFRSVDFESPSAFSLLWFDLTL